MADDKFHQEKVRIAGWTAGASEEPKTTNPHRGKRNDDEVIWDMAWEDGNAGRDFVAS